MNIENFEELLRYLRQREEYAASPVASCTILTGGVSNRTVLVEFADGRAAVLKQALERLRVESDWRSDPRRIEREALGLQWLGHLAPNGSVPPLLFLDKTEHLLAMEAVQRPHTNWKTDLLSGCIKGAHVEQFARWLAIIHSRSLEQAEEIGRVFEDRTFFESLRVEPYYRYTAIRVPEAAPFLQRLIQESDAQRHAVVHGDYSPKNVLVHRDRLILLDYEVIHFGDPGFDLGFSLAHLLSKAHHLATHRRVFIEMAEVYWRTYQDMAPLLARMAGLELRAVHHTLGCLLARVDGRSPLEYFTAEEKRRQRAFVLKLIGEVPRTIPELITAFHNLLLTLT